MNSYLRKIGEVIALVSIVVLVIADKSKLIVPVEIESESYCYSEPNIIEDDSEFISIYREDIEVVYKGLTRLELIDKINNNLNSTLSGKGELFVDYSLEMGVDPYTAVSIVLVETGCKWNCSTLVKSCNNVGGQKGSGAKCGKSAYARFSSLDNGIIAFINNLAKNYVAYGLITPEQMNKKYAESTTWAEKVRSYMKQIENQ